VIYDPATYWQARYEAQGEPYVARGGRQDSHDAQVEAIVPYFEHLPSSGRVLDFGCGPGRFRGALEAQGLEYEGVDLVPELGTMEVGEIEPSSFDCAVAIFVLQHIVDERRYDAAIRVLHSVLRVGGTLLVVDHELRYGMDEHMRARGPSGLLPWTWRGYEMLGDHDGHWVGLFTR
jgi:SAM-dependent methyltransferase